jgi:hypothetical protein
LLSGGLKARLQANRKQKTSCLRKAKGAATLNLPPDQDLEPERSERRKILPPRLQKPLTFAVGGLKT